MKCYEDKSREDLLKIITDLEKQVEQLKANLPSTNPSMDMDTLSCALNSSRLGIIATDFNGRVYYANARIISEHNLDGDIRIYHLSDFLDSKTMTMWHEMINDIRVGDKDATYMIPHTNGHGTYEVFSNIQVNRHGKELIWHFVRDITIRVKQEEEITRLNALLHAILNNIPVYLFVKDVGNDFRYLYWNRAFSEYSGIPAEVAIGKNDFELFSDKEIMGRFHKDDEMVIEKGRIEFEEESTDLHGKHRIVKTEKTAILSESEHPFIIGVSWDVTDIRQAETRLMDAKNKAEEADKLKSSFLANMSHEIRTPLNGIVGFSKLAIEAENEEEKRMYTAIAEKNCDILLNLFNDILDLSSLESDSMEFLCTEVRLAELCENQYELHRTKTQNGVRLILDEIDRSLVIHSDWNKLSQILANLITNAIKFTPKGEIHLGYKLQGDSIQFHVQDTGIGVAADKIARIFQRFGKVNNFVQGTGLGLTLCRMLVEKMGGRIWVRSKEGEGTTFYFTLPFEFISS